MLVALLFQFACGTQPDRAAEVGATHAYRCEDGFTFVTRTEAQRVWLFLPRLTTSLPQIPAASGLHYRDGRIALRAKGDEVTLELEGRTRARCVNQPEQAVWEDARLRGVDFRATGAGRDWSIELDSGTSMVMKTADGARLVFPAPAEDRAQGRTIYESETAGQHIRLVVEDRPCRMHLDGEPLPFSVSVTLDERTFIGCGRPLEPV